MSCLCNAANQARYNIAQNVDTSVASGSYYERGFSTRTSYEYELRVNENKVQLTRIRDENGKFRSILPDCTNSIPYSTF